GYNRQESIDSMHNAIGTGADEQIVGKLLFKIWPLPELGWIE
ncbi:signal peptidase I, partial [Streptococcus suis]